MTCINNKHKEVMSLYVLYQDKYTTMYGCKSMEIK